MSLRNIRPENNSTGYLEANRSKQFDSTAPLSPV